MREFAKRTVGTQGAHQVASLCVAVIMGIGGALCATHCNFP